jgi:hypothetical protein
MSIDKLEQIVEKGLQERKVFEDAKDVIQELRGLMQNKQEIISSIVSLRAEKDDFLREVDKAAATALLNKEAADAIIVRAKEDAAALVTAAKKDADVLRGKAQEAADLLRQEKAALRKEIGELNAERAESAKALKVAEDSLNDVRAKLRGI